MSNPRLRVADNRRSWRLGATSFVYPAGWAHNVEHLGPDFDDIEILLFEQARSAMPSDAELAQLVELRQTHNLSYCVHTPLEPSLASFNSDIRRASVAAVARSLRLGAILGANHFVLHVYWGDREHDPTPPEDIDEWRDRAHRSLKELLSEVDDSTALCIESLDYDIEMLTPVVEDLNLSLALDIGHWVRDGRDTLQALEKLLPRTRLIQWHGTDPTDRDHRSLRHYPSTLGRQVLQTLDRHRYSGVVTLEVFRVEDLYDSVEQLRAWQAEISPRSPGN